jgi:hypothetical protein
MRISHGHGKKLTYYDIGRTPFFALQTDRRFSYCLAVPENYDEDDTRTYSLIVLVHGTERSASVYRDQFVEFAATHDCIVLAPLFPANMTASADLSSYKFIAHGGIRYDRVLLDMVEEVSAKYRLRSKQFLLYGFSGGGHFAHRIFILHPAKLLGVSIGAPGLVTLIDSNRRWWAGVADIEEKFGIKLDVEAMRRVPVHTVIGDQDTETWEITMTPASEWWVEGANDAGGTRLDRITALRRSFEAQGITVEADQVAGAKHVGMLMFPAVRRFMSRVLAEMKQPVRPQERIP